MNLNIVSVALGTTTVSPGQSVSVTTEVTKKATFNELFHDYDKWTLKKIDYINTWRFKDMADTLKNLYKGTLGTSSTTLYTVPASTKTIVKEIVLCNKTASAATATVSFGGINVVAGKSIPANDSLIIEYHSIMEAGTIIAGFAGTASTIDIYISGVEVV